MTRAQTLLADGILLEGIYELEHYLREQPDDLTARMQAAEACYAVGRFQTAAEHAGHVYAADRTYGDARLLLVRIRSRLSQALAATTPEPEDVLFFARLARLMHNIDRAARYYQRYLEHGPDPDVKLEWARMYRWHDRGAAAVPLYRHYLEQHPEDIAVRHELGRLYNALGRHVDAEETLRTAVNQAPDDTAMALDWAQALLWRGDEDAAETVLLRLLDQDPGEVTARAILAQLYHARGSHLEAYAQYRMIIEAAPTHQEARTRLETYRRERTLERARYRQALQSEPLNPELRTGLIQLLYEQEEHAAALDELTIYLAHYPEDEAMQALKRNLRDRQREAILRQLRPFQDAHTEQLEVRIRNAQRWLIHHPQDHFTRHQLAHWQAAAGHYGEAWQEYERLLQNLEPSPTLIAARDRMRRKAGMP